MVLVGFAVLAIAALWPSRDTHRTVTVTAPPIAVTVDPSGPHVVADLTPVAEWATHVVHLETHRVLGDVENAVRTMIEQFPVPVPARQPSPPARMTPAGGGGSLSRAQLVALARCESGTDISNDYETRGGWRTGLFGIEAGYAIGHLSQAEQIAWVNDIYARHGASAWGVGCQGAFA